MFAALPQIFVCFASPAGQGSVFQLFEVLSTLLASYKSIINTHKHISAWVLIIKEVVIFAAYFAVQWLSYPELSQARYRRIQMQR